MRHIVVEAKTELDARVKAQQSLKEDEAVGEIYKIQGFRWHVAIVKDLEDISR